MTKRVLIIAYNFPPMGGGGVQRTAKFVKYLPRFGWEPIVLTAADPYYWAVDTSLSSDVPGGTEIERIPARGHIPVASLLPRIIGSKRARTVTRILFFPDEKISWAKKAARRGGRFIRKHPIDAVFSTSPSPSAHLAAERIARRNNIPWIADFRDLWSGDYRNNADPAWIKKRRLKAEGRILWAADHVVCATEGFRETFIERHRLDPARITAVHNGFDPDDFPAPIQRSGASGDGASIVMIHSGSLYGEGLPERFLSGLGRMLSRDPIRSGRFVLRFIGVMDDAIARRIDSILGAAARIDGYLDHADAVEAVRRADIALLAVPHRENASLVVHGKLFEYLASGTPILAAIPEGEAACIVRETGTGAVMTEDDPDAVADMLPDVIDSLADGRNVHPDMNKIEKYNRIHLTGKLARILNDMTESGHA
ncbi:MAG: glycosyltransferase family 4 protein [Deltaproteobacteria bacterium]|nr:glycosyltransferase family 4 protein [Candidatus Zymogenaceae bacterium]